MIKTSDYMVICTFKLGNKPDYNVSILDITWLHVNNK